MNTPDGYADTSDIPSELEQKGPGRPLGSIGGTRYTIYYNKKLKQHHAKYRKPKGTYKAKDGWRQKKIPKDIQDPLEADRWFSDWLREHESLATVSKADTVLAEAFPAQLAFIKDESKRKVAFVLRRGGKSTLVAIYLLATALANPATKSLYMALTRDSAENIMWLNIMEPILLKLKIKHTYLRSKKTIVLENKSEIKLTGADATVQQIHKLLGGKYMLAIFDECQSITNDLKIWVEEMLGPAMVDYGGTICLLGTAGRAIGRYWFDITQPESNIKSWSIHRWGAEDNPSMAQKLIDEMERLKREQPGIEKTEGFRNQYLCEWVLDNADRVYHNKNENLLEEGELYNSLLNRHPKWMYMVGFDFGFEDDTAFVVAAFSKHDNNFYIVETYKRPQMLTEEIALKLNELKNKYQPIYFVGDCQNKTLVQTLRIQYHLPLRAADKLGKEAHIAVMNSDFTTNKIKVIKQFNEPLLKEWATLVWNEKKRAIGEFEEKASKDNHAADAALYVHHFSKHYRAVPEPQKDERSAMMVETEKRIKHQLAANNNAYSTDEYGIYQQIEDIR